MASLWTTNSTSSKGMQFDRGYLSPYFINNPDKQAVLENPFVLLFDKKISNIRDLLPVLEQVAKAGLSVADHRRGRRRRGAGDPGREQHPWHPEDLAAPSRFRASATAARPCWRTSPSLTGGTGHRRAEEVGLTLEKATLNDLARPAARIEDRQGKHHHHRRRR